MIFLTQDQAEELFRFCHSDQEREAELYVRYFTLRHPRDARPYTHDEAMKLLRIKAAVRILILGRRAGMEVNDWLDAAARTRKDPREEAELLSFYFDERMGPPRCTHEDALRELGF